MTSAPFEPSMLLAILPEMLLVVLAALVLILNVGLRRQADGVLGWFTAIGLAVIAVLSAVFARPAETPQLIFGGMLRLDWVSFSFRLLFLLGAAITVLVSIGHLRTLTGEYLALVLVATLGMSLMASSANLIMLYLAIETTSLPLYILAGFHIESQKSVESGIKYMLYGAVTSAVMLYGFSWLFGLSGTANLAMIPFRLTQSGVSSLLVGGALFLTLVGFGFKISVAPFHFWAPDVYEGAPTPIAGFLSTASKAAGFAVLVRVLLVVFPQMASFWTMVVAILAALSMIIGNLLALTQRNLKRLLAYSSIAQAGYILVGVAADSPLGVAGMVYYLASYLVTNLAAFAIVWLVAQQVGSDDLDAFAGLGKRNPAIALAMLISLLSLGGIPPLSGFIGKVLVFAAAIESGQIALALIGVLTSVIGLYYYLTVMKTLYRPGADETPLRPSIPWQTAVLICVVLMLALGVIVAPWYGQSLAAASALF